MASVRLLCRSVAAASVPSGDSSVPLARGSGGKQEIAIGRLFRIGLPIASDTLAEWLRRRPAKPMGSPRVGSNPTGVDLFKLVNLGSIELCEMSVFIFALHSRDTSPMQSSVAPVV